MSAEPETIAAAERQEFREMLVSIMETNMGIVFAAEVKAYGEVSVESAVNGAVAMFEFGLVLAERHPEAAATLREASRERDESRGLPVSTEKAVDAVVLRHAALQGS